ncbi:NAD(P)/FAD-dependent oxidoreductase [Frankia sp. CNm7]|uniref:NAD(P)/FAD-dependent oxidoreductase n=1 Tax=Frankia nepalensis TaxID=1836974 RepID=A0A937RRD8_9ACTN|nr:NAD(P)/FAD-dependent oxidoreductase [Frankia nepalensis]MBL7502068.1 NAD(P)/FAD-dependent oxidoreductase [Frankia nepalensis]MBL7511802.1 NAD(P)/FAD-dependent oxidoreductase [Frankia nepalensis]MBL7524655.1 NAD(P)/FAD-dependent oxidoreductase [Frankia nepalensis]MBL7630566.1 NAD(P)/FAD-dependent oxidoreductase [Frankia nepalensis]
MRLDFTREDIDADDATIRAQAAQAPVAPLLAAVAQLTGEYDLLSDDIRPDPALPWMPPDYGYPSETAARARLSAADALIRYRDRRCPPPVEPDPKQLRALVEFVVAPAAVDDDYLELLQEELALGGDLRAPRWRVATTAPRRRFSVAVIGAGMSGLVAAHRLRQAGVDVRVFEKNTDLGGTWLENSYPGCRVDVPNHLYSYSFAQTGHWPQFNSTQPVLLDYFRSCADEFGLAELISLGTEVVEARWNDQTSRWALRLRDASGAERTHEANAVVSAVGQLNRPSLPDIEGIDSFGGPYFHSARWRHDIDVTGRRVAVIGTGASAVQFVPPLAERAARLTVYQRTAPWLLPVPNYHDDLPAEINWLLRHVPDYARWDRLTTFGRLQEGTLPQTIVDPRWDRSNNSVSAVNDLARRRLTAWYEAVFPDPALRAKVLPTHFYGAKRMIPDSGRYAATLQRPDVTLETAEIGRITPSGIQLADGRHVDHDVIVYGTGFQASRFLTPMRVVGAGGLDLHDWWDGDARAHLGITVPRFPNLFLMYGPNTNIVVNGSIIYFSECAARYITECVGLLLARDAASLDCRPEAHDRYNEWIDAATDERAWGVSDVHTWYRNGKGRIAQNWPFNLYDYWRLTRAPNPADYVLR